MPLIHIFGCCSVLLWSMVAATGGTIWSALMTKPDQYVAFTLSRLFVGLFSATPTILGPQMLVEIFFLHERGTVFNFFMVWSTFGTVIGPTLGGFIADHAPWPYEFWWTVALQGVVILLGMRCNGGLESSKRLITFFISISLPRRDRVHSRGPKSVSPSTFKFRTKSSGHVLSRHARCTYWGVKSSSE